MSELLDRYHEANKRRKQINDNDDLAVALFYLDEYSEFGPITGVFGKKLVATLVAEIKSLRAENERLQKKIAEFIHAENRGEPYPPKPENQER